MPRPLALALFFASFCIPASGQSDDYHIATRSGLWVQDRGTGTLTFLAGGFLSPLYGDIWDFNGTTNPTWILPDSVWGSVSLVDTVTGAVTVLSSGGLLGQPATVEIDPVAEVFYVSDLANDHVVQIDKAGNQTLWLDNSSGLMSQTSGLAFGPDGQMYVANFGNGTLVVVPPGGGTPTLVSDGAGLTQGIGGIVADGSGNVYAADWYADHIVRFRVEDGTAVVHSADAILDGPNDVKLTRDGKLLTTTFGTSALVELDVLGNAVVLGQNAALGWWQGVAVDQDFPYPTGRMDKYGTGTAGSGGFVPDLRGVYSPNIGAEHGLEFRDILGGSKGFLHLGFDSASLPGLGGVLLVSFQPPWLLIPISHPGTGDGGSNFVLKSSLALDPGLVGAELYLQDLVLDAGAPKGIAMSNGLKMTIGQ